MKWKTYECPDCFPEVGETIQKALVVMMSFLLNKDKCYITFGVPQARGSVDNKTSSSSVFKCIGQLSITVAECMR